MVLRAVQECTSLFDVLGFMGLMQDMFYVQHVKFSPTDLGIPSHRLRSYTLSVNKARVVVRIPFSKECLQERFFREMVCTAEVFFRAPESYVIAYLYSLVRTVRGDHAAASLWGKNSWDVGPENYLTASDENRLNEQKASSMLKGFRFLCSNITQSDSFMKFDSSCPCILRRAKIFGHNWAASHAGAAPRISRLMTPYEYLAAQGLPVLLPKKHKLTSILPKQLSFGSAYSGRGPPTAMLSSLSGNGMHLAQVGLCLVWCLLGCSPLPDSTSGTE